MTVARDNCTAVFGRSGASRKVRHVLLATTVLTPVLMSSHAAQAQAVIDAGTTVTVPGTQASPWNVGGDLTVGNTGAGTLNIGATGVVNSGNSVIGAQASGQGTVSVGGANATWNSTGTISVGSVGVGNLAIFGGGAVNAGSGIVGGSNLGTVGVSGIGSIWNNTVSVTVGGSATGTGFVTISAGGAGTASSTVIGNQPNATGTLTVTGAGSTWDSTNMTVGSSGTGTLNVSDGGAVTGANASIGGSSGSSGTVTVTGAGSSWIVTNNFEVGGAGQGHLSVLSGATVSSGIFQSRIGVYDGSDGTVTVSGTGSIWNANQLHIGAIGDFAINGNGGSGALNITSGGRVNSTSASVADGNGATGSVSVSGTGSLWSNTGDLSIGVGGGSASGFVSGGGLAISNGGQVTTTGDAYVGQSSEGNGQVTVFGAGSSFTTGGRLRIGDQGAGFFTVGDAAIVTVGGGAGTVFIGTAPTASGVLSIGGGFGDPAAAVGSLQAGLIDFGTGSGILNFNHTSTNYIFAPEITGGGTIINAAGSTTLGTGSTSFTGTANVTGGTLSVNAFFGNGSFNVATGAILGGTGTVGDTTIASGGTLAPGNSIGTLTVAGNLFFNPGSIYAVEVSPTASDRTNVSGTATLGGATVAASFAPGSYIAKQYTIVNATGGVSGTFASLVNTNLPAGFNSGLSYDANNAYLNLTLEFGFSGMNRNQQNVANALSSYFNTTGGIPAAFGALNAKGLSGVSGEVGAAVAPAGFMAMNQFINAIGDALVSVNVAPGADEASSYAPVTKLSPQQAAAHAAVTPRDQAAVPFVARWNVWASGYGGNSSVNGDADTGSHNTSTRVYGTVAGADYRPGPDTRFGFALGGAGTAFSLDTGLGSGRTDLFQAGGYARHQMGAAYLIGTAAYGWQDVATNRTVAGTDVLRGHFQANTFALRGEGGWNVGQVFANATPYAALQVSNMRLPAYNESTTSGSSQFALSYAAQSETDVRTELGLRADQSWYAPEGQVILRGRAAWIHDTYANPSAASSFQTLPGSSFVVYGAAQSPDALLTTASLEAKWLNGFSVGATLASEFSKTSSSLAGRGSVRYSW